MGYLNFHLKMFLVIKGRGQNWLDPFKIAVCRGGMKIFRFLKLEMEQVEPLKAFFQDW